MTRTILQNLASLSPSLGLMTGSPLRRRASGLALALGINALLLYCPALRSASSRRVAEKTPSRALVVDLLPELHSAQRPAAHQGGRAPPGPSLARCPSRRRSSFRSSRRSPRRPPRPGSRYVQETRWAAADVGNLPKGAGSGGDSEVVGSGPHGEMLYNAEWAREPTDAESGGYMPHNAAEGGA